MSADYLEIKGKTVMAFDKGNYNKSMTDVVIPEGITDIANSAFALSSRYVNSIRFPKTLKKIGKSAFRGVPVKEIVLHEGLEEIGDDAFASAVNVTSLSIPSSVRKIGKDAFYGLQSLRELTIPEGVLEIGDFAFSGCVSLKRVVLPSTLTKLGDQVFSGCGLESAELKEGITYVGDALFFGCPNLKEVIIPKGVTRIKECAFSGCKALKSIELPYTLTHIDKGAFSSSGLSEMVIPNSVTQIGESAFARCEHLGSLTIGRGVSYVGKNLLIGAYSRVQVKALVTEKSAQGWHKDWNVWGTRSNMRLDEENITFDDDFSKGDVPPEETCRDLGVLLRDKTVIGYEGDATELELPEGLEAVEAGAFKDKKALVSVTLPSGLKNVARGAFMGVSPEIKIVIKGESLQYHAWQDGWSVYKKSLFGEKRLQNITYEE